MATLESDLFETDCKLNLVPFSISFVYRIFCLSFCFSQIIGNFFHFILYCPTRLMFSSLFQTNFLLNLFPILHAQVYPMHKFTPQISSIHLRVLILLICCSTFGNFLLSVAHCFSRGASFATQSKWYMEDRIIHMSNFEKERKKTPIKDHN
uniref:Transmembrane protein n=1 Tax=Cacopsylla melanoneura TaxID=428564 RepID=A0A8D8VPC9_9HEMI